MVGNEKSSGVSSPSGLCRRIFSFIFLTLPSGSQPSRSDDTFVAFASLCKIFPLF
jgi:hypothetical protein